MFEFLASKQAKLDMLHLDGRLIKEDIKLLSQLLKADTLIALDDCEGDEKGHMNLIYSGALDSSRTCLRETLREETLPPLGLRNTLRHRIPVAEKLDQLHPSVTLNPAANRSVPPPQPGDRRPAEAAAEEILPAHQWAA